VNALQNSISAQSDPVELLVVGREVRMSYIIPYRLCRAQIDLFVLLKFSVNVMRIK